MIKYLYRVMLGVPKFVVCTQAPSTKKAVFTEGSIYKVVDFEHNWVTIQDSDGVVCHFIRKYPTSIFVNPYSNFFKAVS